MRRVALLLTALTLVLVPTTARAGSHQGDKRYAAQAVAATNQQRFVNGLPGLAESSCLRRFAVRQATAMARQHSMYHQDLGLIMRACGLDLVGENVAYGFSSGSTVVDEGWMNSEGHRANILGADYRLIAIGARQGSGGRWYVSQVFGRKS